MRFGSDTMKEENFKDIYKKSFWDYYNNKVNNFYKKEEFFNNYQNIIWNTKKLFEELNITNHLLIATFYEYLLWNGLFSVNKKFQINNVTNLNSNFALEGSVIMTGFGVCRHISSLEKDILNSLNIESYNMICTLKKNFTFDNSKTIFENLKSKIDITISNNLSKISLGNHLITLIKYNKGYILHDATNHAFLNFKKHLQAKYVNVPMTLDLIFNNFYNCDLKYEEILVIREKLRNQKNIKILNKLMVEMLYEYISYIYQENISLLNDFYNENRNDYETINKILILK